MQVKYTAIAVFVLITLSGILTFFGPHPANAQAPTWSSPVNISSEPGFSWFPDIAVDEMGIRMWSGVLPQSREQWNSKYGWEGLLYQPGRHRLLEPNDIVPPSEDIIRSAIASDLRGNIDLVFGGSVYNRNFALYFSHASSSAAMVCSKLVSTSPGKSRQQLHGRYRSGLDGVIHIVYDDTIRHSGENSDIFSDIYYRNSTDNGISWSNDIIFTRKALPDQPSQRWRLIIMMLSTSHGMKAGIG